MASDEARKVDPTSLGADEGRAHALLLLGRTDEALAVYRANVGKKGSAKTWDELILDDFNELEAAGVSSPDMNRVRQIVGNAERR